jgi:hypothetical protein
LNKTFSGEQGLENALSYSEYQAIEQGNSLEMGLSTGQFCPPEDI